MKKLIVGLLMAAMTALGLVAVTSAPSNAVNCATYPGCVRTSLDIDKTNRLQVGEVQRVEVTVNSASNADASGTVTVQVIRVGGGYRYTQTKAYTNGNTVTFRSDPVAPRGKYKIRVKFVGSLPFADATNNKKKFVVVR